jgi:hypothetical protein
MKTVRGPVRAIIAIVLLSVSGVLSVIYGIGAIGNSSFFVADARYVFGNLRTWGWVSLIIGVIEIVAALSLVRLGRFGRYVGILVGCLAALDALLEIPAYPLWSIAVFALSVWIIFGLTAAPDQPALWSQPGESPGETASSAGLGAARRPPV